MEENLQPNLLKRLWFRLRPSSIQTYMPLTENEDDHEKLTLGKTETPEILRTELWMRLLAGFVTISICLNIFLTILLHQPTVRNLDRVCNDYTTKYDSPVSDEIDITYSTVNFNGSFFKETIFRQAPGSEVDAAWDSIAHESRVRIPEDEAERYGIQKGQVKMLEEEGGGYPADVEVLHHLHCLNLLRISLWFNYDHYYDIGAGVFANNELDVVQHHVTHCLDTLRQQLMCTSDVSVFGQWWVADVGPFVDFNTQHRCKNFDDVLEWTEAHRIADDTKVRKRPGDVVLPAIP